METICPKCEKSWWLRVVGEGVLICGCGYQHFEPEVDVNPLPERKCPACKKMYVPGSVKSKRCPVCSNGAHRAEAKSYRLEKKRLAANG
jgi:hypothetical protein